MVRRVVGRFGREMNREPVNNRGPKTTGGARLRNPRRVSAPRSRGIGPYYREEDDI